MRTGNQECKHCGTTYTVQYSGSHDVTGIPREYQDKEYCGDCKKVIVEALSNVVKKFEYRHVETDEVNLDTLLRWEKENLEEYRILMDSNAPGYLLPQAKRVFAHLMNQEMTESQVIEQVIGREEKKGRIYIYCYWPSKRDECTITVEKRINLLTDEEVGYKLR